MKSKNNIFKSCIIVLLILSCLCGCAYDTGKTKDSDIEKDWSDGYEPIETVGIYNPVPIKAKKCELSFVDLTGLNMLDVKRTVYGYNTLYPESGIEIIEAGDNSSDQRATKSRIMAEIVAGKGPDIVVVNYDDMLNLYEKNAIIPVDSMIFENNKNCLLPAAIDYGSIDGTMVALTPFFNDICSCIVDKRVCEQEIWSIDDVLCIKNSHPEIKRSFVCGFLDTETRADWISVFDVYGTCLYTSRYINYDNGKSTFDSPNFIELLKNAFRDNHTYLTINNINDGSVLGEIIYVSTPRHFLLEYLNRIEKDNWIGFPRDFGGGNIVDSDAFIVVNANSHKADAIEKYLNYVISLDFQQTIVYGVSIRQDIAMESIIETDKGAVWKTLYGDRVDYMYLNTKAPTEDLIHAYEGLANSFVPLKKNKEIEEIITDEVYEYINGDDIDQAEEVANRIQTRVQLYLDEHK